MPEMEKTGLGLGCSAREKRKHDMQLALIHACLCRNANCHMPPCRSLKRVVAHTNTCKQKANGKCNICLTVIELCCDHVLECQKPNCPVSFCNTIKEKLKQHMELQEE